MNMKKGASLTVLFCIILVATISVFLVAKLYVAGNQSVSFLKEIADGRVSTIANVNIKEDLDFDTIDLTGASFVLVFDQTGNVDFFASGFPTSPTPYVGTMEMLLQTASLSNNAYARGFCPPGSVKVCTQNNIGGDLYRQECYCK